MDKRKIKGDETKQQILMAATEILAAEGSSGISSQKIADKVGISKSNLFHHFKSIDAIQLEIVKQLISGISEPGAVPQFDSLEGFFEGLGFQYFRNDPEFLAPFRVTMSFYFDMLFKQKYGEQLAGFKSIFVDFLMEIIRAIEGKAISRDLAELIAMDIDGLGLHFLVDLDDEKYQRLWRIKYKMYISEIRGT